MNLIEKIEQAGVVGAGGAGFPTHIKARAEVEYLLANGAECEPLLHKDLEIMVHHAPEILRGFEAMMDQITATTGHICIKSKNKRAIAAFQPLLLRAPISLFELGDFYPSGDEYEIVYSATGRLIPAGGIPLHVGCVVSNVETLYNVARAMEDIPVTETFMCMAGAVREPKAFFAPVGTKFRDLIDFAGGPTTDSFAIYVSGVMMGQLSFDLDDVVTKTTAGLIILPRDHQLVRRKNQPEQNWHRIGKSACDQCTYCTELCPRYLLGYNVQPHKVMRSLGFTKTGASMWNRMAELCCACGLCTLYSCPEDLFPKEACDRAKNEMRQQGVQYKQEHPVVVHAMKEARRVPLKQLIKRLNLHNFEADTPYTRERPPVNEVKIKLKQHIGQPAKPVVGLTQKVSIGQLIAEPEPGQMGAKLHASIVGTITEITTDYIRISN